ncbi:MAG: NUDIX hydrolase [Myxococcales bacterium]|nr:NUDIX hydrolase [Myxococcales bacterium]
MDREDRPGEADDRRDRRRLLTARKFAVDAVRVTGRSGAELEREVVVHPGAVVVLPLREDGRVVMLRSRRFAVDETLWELPAGTLEPGEAPASCAARELQEETGYTAARLEPLHAFFTTPGFCSERMHAFVAAGARPLGRQALGETERVEVELVSPARLDELLARGDIVDGKTLVTLLLWRHLHAPAR